jgi:hypothetical protein
LAGTPLKSLASSTYGGNLQDSSPYASPKPSDAITEELEPSCECRQCVAIHQHFDELETSLEGLEEGSEISNEDLNFMLEDPYSYSLLTNFHISGQGESDAEGRDKDTEVKSRFAHNFRALADWLRQL